MTKNSKSSDQPGSATVVLVLRRLFPGIGDDSIEAFVDVGNIVKIDRDDVICTPDQPIVGFTLVLTGAVVVEQGGHKIREFGMGHYLGEGRFVRDEPPTVTIRAKCPSWIFQVEARASRRFLRRNPGFGVTLLTSILNESIARLEATNALFVENRQLAEEVEQNNEKLNETLDSLRTANDRLMVEMDERAKTEERVRHMATHDTLTGLPNRQMFQDYLGTTLAQCMRREGLFALFFIDLNDFKEVNDVHGHDIGDMLLQEFANRLLECVRSQDTVARMGGDEFAIIMSDIDSQTEPSTLADRILTRMQDVATLGDLELPISPSIGIALFPDDATEAEEIVRKADLAMYRSKAEVHAAYHYFEPELESQAVRSTMIKNRLRIALDKGELTAFYQPKIEIGSGKIVGMEALVRWGDEKTEGFDPGEFIPVAERTGLIVPLGEAVMRSAFQQAGSWFSDGLSGLRLAVNLSPMQFWKSDVCRLIDEALSESDLAAESLEVEVTEGVLMHDSDGVLKTIAKLQDMGITVAVDDFGTGYSSLSYLSQLGADTVKIDRAFVNQATVAAGDATICRAIVGLAKSLGMRVVAEGVESIDQLEFLREIGCDEAQGYFVSPPLNDHEFGPFVDRWSTPWH